MSNANSRSGESLPPHPDTDKVLDKYPFMDIIDMHFDDRGDPDLLDEIAVDLHESEFMKDLEAQLSTSPKYSGLYRFDPFTLGSRAEWEGMQVATGAKRAWFRVFKDLTFDKVWVVRSDNEALIVINHPSVLVSTRGRTVESEEPVVLFTSRQLNIPVSQDEELAYGVVFKHGDHKSDVMPAISIANPSVVVRYYHYDREQQEMLTRETEQ